MISLQTIAEPPAAADGGTAALYGSVVQAEVGVIRPPPLSGSVSRP